MTKKAFGTAIPRLRQDYLNLNKDPVPYIRAEPLPSDMLEWHYVIKGPEDTPYLGGYYHGTLVFSQQYPFKPPSIYMSTPNGRFDINRRLCLSISDYHPDEWNPAWCVSSILTGLLSFMLESSPALGTIETSTVVKRQFARKSLAYNIKNEVFRTLFPDITDEINEKLNEIKEIEKIAAAAAASLSTSSGKKTTLNGELVADDDEKTQTQNSDDTSSINNLILAILTGILGLIVYHIVGIMNTD